MTKEFQPPQPRIVCAANKHEHEGVSHIITGARHWDPIMAKQISNYKALRHPSVSIEWKQGFIDQFGRFYDRKEAMQVVLESGQPFNKERNCGGAESEDLYSEGLY